MSPAKITGHSFNVSSGPRLRRREGAPPLRGAHRRVSSNGQRATSATARTKREMRAGGTPLLEVAQVSMQFGGLTALRSVSISAHQAVVTAVIGPNGAGKTTLFNVVSGALRPTEGSVTLSGQDITDAPPRVRARSGLARTFQNGALFESLTVTENVLAGSSRYAKSGFTESMFRGPRALADERFARQVAGRAIRMLELDRVADKRCADLAYGLRRRTEIARALAAGPRLLLLDEPSAGMDPQETRELAALLNRIVDVLGVGVLIVEHDMSMVDQCVDHLFVLDAGAVIAEGLPRDVLQQDVVRVAYFGGRRTENA